jgi:hypothetical protein
MSTARTRFLALTLGLLVATPAAWAQGGLRLADATRPQETAWPRWQARLGLATTASAIDPGTLWHASAGQLLGDYYWSGLRPAGASLSGGFRATGGLLLGQRSLALGTPTLSAPLGVGLTLSRIARPSTGFGEVMGEPWSAAPYVGIGYSGISIRGGWGFTADVGLAGATGGLRTRRDATFSSQGAEDLLRELRLTPVLQVGASYAF